jgi:hypothetical protein
MPELQISQYPKANFLEPNGIPRHPSGGLSLALPKERANEMLCLRPCLAGEPARKFTAQQRLMFFSSL